jgi:hypothetical protein
MLQSLLYLGVIVKPLLYLILEREALEKNPKFFSPAASSMGHSSPPRAAFPGRRKELYLFISPLPLSISSLLSCWLCLIFSFVFASLVWLLLLNVVVVQPWFLPSTTTKVLLCNPACHPQPLLFGI